jgi:hypothetical protein
MDWKFFLGAALLAATLVAPHAGFKPVVAGVVLARAIQYTVDRRSGGNRSRE